MNTKFIKLYFIFITCLSANISSAQQQIVTRSGQNITLLPDGKWLLTEKTSEDIVTNSQIFEVPVIASSELSENDITEVLSMISDLESIEANSRVQMEFTYRKIQILDLDKEVAKSNRNDEEYKKSLDLLKLEKNKVKTYEDYQDNSYDLIKKLKKIYKKGSSKFVKEINKIKTDANEKLGTTYPLSEEIVVFEPEVKKVSSRRKALPNTERYALVCDIEYNEFDAAIMQDRKSTSMQHLFDYTHPKTKMLLKTKNFLNAECNASKVGEFYYINFNIKMASKDAIKSYGYVAKNEKIILTLINGQRINGLSIMTSEGIVEPYSGASIYDLRYRIEKKDFKRLSEEEIRSVGILWSSGYEEYNVYNIDLVKNQTQCILN